MFNLVDWLFFLRQFMILIYSWILSPLLLNRFNEPTAKILMFLFSILITFVFLRISKKENGKGFLLKIIYYFLKNKKFLTAFVLFVFNPFLFIVYYKRNYCLYGELNKKFWILLIANTAFTTLWWAEFIFISGIKI